MAPARYRADLDELARAAGDLLLEAPAKGEIITGLSRDSARVEHGDLFFCVPGRTRDGHVYAAEAVAAGAVALCVERRLELDVPQIAVSDARRAQGRIAARFFGHPGESLQLVGITGTNGKTTTTFLLESILSVDGGSTGLIGTIETRIGGTVRPGVRTTPDALDLQELLADMRDAGVARVAMEVTSHALALHRVEGLRFRAAAFTNLSQDHLDFHEGMEEYFEAKRSLFVRDRAERGAVNLDDPYGRRLLSDAEIPCLGFSVEDTGADVYARDVEIGPHGSSFSLHTATGSIPVSTSLAGMFNVSNCLAAAAAAVQIGIDPDSIAEGLARVSSVPGRFESVDAGQPFAVLVDYAHTPDSLDNVLRAARNLSLQADGNGSRAPAVVCVFGCGGDRDRGKRPLMGAVAARLADKVVVTSDNPRSEDPMAIVDQILEGVIAERPEGPDVVTPDRAEAIARAIELARPGDVVVIAGKGHETGQEFADRTVPFDDRVVAREALVASRRGAGA